VDVYEEFKEQKINRDQLISMIKHQEMDATGIQDWLSDQNIYNAEEKKRQA
jgi:hypothetical protein